MPDQCYFTDSAGKGDFFQCLQETAAGESPATNPEKWCRIQLPKAWRSVLAKLTYAALLEMDGQTDKAERQRAVAEGMDHTGLVVLIQNEANRDTWRTRPQVQTPLDPLTRNKFLFSREQYAGVESH